MFSYEIVSTLFFLAVGVAITISSWAIGFGKWEDPGPGFMGTLSGAGLTLLSIIWLAYSKAKRPQGSSQPIRFFPESQSPVKIIKVLLPLCGFALFLKSLGFLICSFLFLTFLFKDNSRSWSRTLLYSLAASITTHLVFEVWLQVQFPEGLLPTYRIKQWIF
jgi:hypothetical protein